MQTKKRKEKEESKLAPELICDECGSRHVRMVTYPGAIKMHVCRDCGSEQGEVD